MYSMYYRQGSNPLDSVCDKHPYLSKTMQTEQRAQRLNTRQAVVLHLKGPQCCQTLHPCSPQEGKGTCTVPLIHTVRTYIHTYIPPVNHTLDEPSRSSSELPRMFKVVRVLESCPGTVIKRLYPRCSCSMVERCYNQTEAHTEYSLPQQSALLSYIIWYRSPLSMYVRMQHSTQHSTLLHLNTISLNHCSVLQ